MKEHPIPFSGPMVRAILAGNKTQTRRVIQGLDPHWVQNIRPQWAKPDEWCFMDPADPIGTSFTVFRCPYGQPGDVLWVREAIAVSVAYDAYPGGLSRHVGAVEYRAGGGFTWGDERGRWRPSIHMPRWAARLLLEVVEVRVQRVQDITDADARAEGIVGLEKSPGFYPNWTTTEPLMRPRDSFRELWDSINAKRGFGWDVNPWVWAVTFKRVES